MFIRPRIQRIERIRFAWKAIPSEARVTRDEVSGSIKQSVAAVWKTVPISPPLVFIATRRQQGFKGTRIALMQRICSFHGFLFDAHGLCAPDGRMDFYGFFLRLRQSRADRRKKILFRSKNNKESVKR